MAAHRSSAALQLDPSSIFSSQFMTFETPAKFLLIASSYDRLPGIVNPGPTNSPLCPVHHPTPDIS